MTKWYKEFWVWVIIGLPLSVMIGCGYTVYIAYKNADSVVVDEGLQNTAEINQQLEHIATAKKLGIKADIGLSRKTGEVRLVLHRDATSPVSFANAQQIQLRLEHPTIASFDETIELSRQAKGIYTGTLKKFYSGPRYVSLKPNGDDWELKGKLYLFTDAAQTIG